MFSKFCSNTPTIGFDLKSNDVHIFNAQIYSPFHNLKNIPLTTNLLRSYYEWQCKIATNYNLIGLICVNLCIKEGCYFVCHVENS
jgi:hypothetical protein